MKTITSLALLGLAIGFEDNEFAANVHEGLFSSAPHSFPGQLSSFQNTEPFLPINTETDYLTYLNRHGNPRNNLKGNFRPRENQRFYQEYDNESSFDRNSENDDEFHVNVFGKLPHHRIPNNFFYIEAPPRDRGSFLPRTVRKGLYGNKDGVFKADNSNEASSELISEPENFKINVDQVVEMIKDIAAADDIGDNEQFLKLNGKGFLSKLAKFFQDGLHIVKKSFVEDAITIGKNSQDKKKFLGGSLN